MKTLKRSRGFHAGLLLTALFLLAACNGNQETNYATIRQGFNEVPDSVRTGCFWYWISDNISCEGVAADLKAMKEAGIGAAFIGCIGESDYYDSNYPNGPVKFYSDEWWEVLHTALRTATELGIDIGIFNCPGWSQSGGPWVRPEQAMRYLAKAELRLQGPAHIEQTIPQPADDFEDVCVLAFPVKDFVDPALEPKAKPGRLATVSDDPRMAVSLSDVRNVSAAMDSTGTLRWDVPEGRWIVMRLGMTPTGVVNGPATVESTGLETDKMSRKHIAAHFDAYLGEILRRIPEADRQCWKYTIVDSYEKDWQNYTDDMASDFAQRFGYDPTPYLPAYYGYAVGSLDESQRFQWDVRRFLAERVATEYVGGLRDESHRHGLKTWLENYGHWGFCSEFLAYGGQSDEISGEFWTSRHNAEKRASSSCARIYGKTRAWAESFTNDGRPGKKVYDQEPYRRYPGTDKYYLDKAFGQGINSIIFHVFISQYADDTLPGVDAWFGTEYNRKNTWFSQVDAFVDYIRRCSYLLQQGQCLTDIAYYIGEDTPIMYAATQPEPPTGYDFDFVNSEILLLASCVDGRICLPSGSSYRVLVLPNLPAMSEEVIDKLAELSEAGATIVGPAPTQATGLKNYPAADEHVRQVARQLWEERKAIRTDSSLTTVFADLGLVADCYAGADDIVYTHRVLADGTQIYFIANQSHEPKTLEPRFRVTGCGAEIWDPVTGSIQPAVAHSEGEVTLVPLTLAEGQSLFVVFNSQTPVYSKEAAPEAASTSPTLIDLSSDWTVSFQSDDTHRGPQEPMVFEQLTDFSLSTDECLKYYSGEAVYRRTFHMEPAAEGKRLFFEVENVGVMARVVVNGKVCGTLWTAPYRVDVTDALVEGENNIEITVVNTWLNRAIGDLSLPAEQRRLSIYTWPWGTDSPLQPSGLIGKAAISE